MVESTRKEPGIAVIVDSLQSDFVKEALEGMRAEALLRKLALHFVEVGSLSYPERIYTLARLLESGRISAAMYVHVALTQDQASLFVSRKIPLGYLAGSLEGAHWVATDEADGGAQVAGRFLRLGHRRLALVSGPKDNPECQLREEGFVKRLAEAGVALDPALFVRTRDFTAWQGKMAGLSLLKAKDRPSAVFVAAGDLVASGVMQAAAEKGVSVPASLSVMGYDNLPLAEQLTPPLCTVRQPLQAMALRLLRSLSEAVASPGRLPLLAQRLNPLLVQRGSCAAPQSGAEPAIARTSDGLKV